MTIEEFIKLFEASDPEPRMVGKVEDKYVHLDRFGNVVNAGWHYKTEEVERHIAWLRRFQEAYRQWVTR